MGLRKIFTTYAIINIEDLDKVDFLKQEKLLQTLLEKNLLDPPTQFVLKWDTEPTFITDNTVVPDAAYSHKDFLELMNTSTWSNPEPEFG